MIFDNMEFFNVDNLQKFDGMSGWRLNRFPQELNESFGFKTNVSGRFRALRTLGCEIRFVTDAPQWSITLTAVESEIQAIVFFGDNFHAMHRLQPGVASCLHIERHEVYNSVDLAKKTPRRFANNVWRILFSAGGKLFYNFADTYGFSRRPPNDDEKPRLKMASYGSSITCGSNSVVYTSSYVHQMGLRLKADIMNKGMSGACMLEAQTADYLASLDVDILTLELGVNMAARFPEEDFEPKAAYLLNTLKQKSPAKKIFVTDIFVFRAAIPADPTTDIAKRYITYPRIVKAQTESIGDSRFVYIPGEMLSRDFSNLTTDLIHPSDEGHVFIGENFAKAIAANI